VGLYVRLSVSDGGCGMDKATASRIFEPFFTTKAVGKGTGLGLAVVHGIMKKHDGAVTVYSEPGKGTTFHLYFPAAGPLVEQKPQAHIETPRGLGERILCIDDEKPIMTVVTRILERLGYKVTGHGYASSAMQEFRARPNEFDAVVTDLALRGMSGLELATELLRLRPGIPIILTSGYFSPEDTERAKLLGIRELIQKPSTLGELGGALHRALREARSRA
jgi:CheY-like chemotaxis protein